MDHVAIVMLIMVIAVIVVGVSMIISLMINDVYGKSDLGTSRRIRKRSKKGMYPEHLYDMWRFSYWDAVGNEITSLKSLLEDMNSCLMKVNEGDEGAFRHALLAFEEKEFIDALSKYRIIRENQNLLETFNANESNPERDRHSYQLQQKQVIAPLRKGIADFFDRYNEFELLEEKTKVNELNILLQQDFSKLNDIKAVNEPADTYEMKPLETI